MNRQKDCCWQRHKMLLEQGHTVGLNDSSQPMMDEVTESEMLEAEGKEITKDMIITFQQFAKDVLTNHQYPLPYQIRLSILVASAYIEREQKRRSKGGSASTPAKEAQFNAARAKRPLKPFDQLSERQKKRRLEIEENEKNLEKDVDM